MSSPKFRDHAAQLHCHDIWYPPTLTAYNEAPDNVWLQMLFPSATITPNTEGHSMINILPSNCLFSVIQSHAQLSVATIQHLYDNLFQT